MGVRDLVDGVLVFRFWVKVSGCGFRVWGFGFREWGLGF